jgi:hypothetical protein
MPEIKLVHVSHVGGDVYALRPFHLPVAPDQGLPGSGGHPDQGLPPTGGGEVPDQGLPPTDPAQPEQPIQPVPPGIWPPTPQQGFIIAYIPGHGWNYVKLPGPSAGQLPGAPPTAQPKR